MTPTAAARPEAALDRVSRRAFARRRPLWLATGSMYLAFALATAASAALQPQDPGFGPWALAAWLVVAAAGHLAVRPPAVQSALNQGALVCAWASVAAAFLIAAPGALAVGGAMFVAPLISVRLDRPGPIVLHTAAASGAFLAIAAAGLFAGVVTDATALAAGLVAIATPVQAVSCSAILHAAEAQALELEAAIRRDGVTGIGNRRGFDDHLLTITSPGHAAAQPLSVLVLDVDEFSSILAADPSEANAILCRVAEVLSRSVPAGSYVARLDGDEFVAVIPGASDRAVAAVASASEAALASIARPDGRPLAACVGTATMPGDGTSVTQILDRADHRVLEAKIAHHAGRSGAAGRPFRPAVSPGARR